MDNNIDRDTPDNLIMTLKSKRKINPNSLANLSKTGTKPKYGERKAYCHLGITPTAKERLKEMAHEWECGSMSEFVEQIARGKFVLSRRK